MSEQKEGPFSDFMYVGPGGASAGYHCSGGSGGNGRASSLVVTTKGYDPVIHEGPATVEFLQARVAHLESRISAIVWQLNASAKSHGLIISIDADGVLHLKPTQKTTGDVHE